jgi:hypothetical protein
MGRGEKVGTQVGKPEARSRKGGLARKAKNHLERRKFVIPSKVRDNFIPRNHLSQDLPSVLFLTFCTSRK